MPCDNHSNVVNQQYVEVIDCIENIVTSLDYNACIVCGDYNTSFSRANAQTSCLSEFITRNNLHNSRTHPNYVADFTYTNFSLNHMSCIDYSIVTESVFDIIVSNYVIVNPTNPPHHNPGNIGEEYFNQACGSLLKFKKSS